MKAGKLHVSVKFHLGKVNLYTVSLPDYEAYLNANDPQKLAATSTLKGPHELVSLRKKRFADGKYDLDLACMCQILVDLRQRFYTLLIELDITEQIIAMGFPSDGMEKMYRNSMKQTQDFLNDYHPSSYKVFFTFFIITKFLFGARFFSLIVLNFRFITCVLSDPTLPINFFDTEYILLRTTMFLHLN